MELSAITFALSKLDFFLRYAKGVTVYTDHKSLVGASNKDFSNHKSPRLLRLLEKTIPYNIDIQYIPGGDNAVANTFSHLCSSSTEAEELKRLYAPSIQQRKSQHGAKNEIIE